MTGKKLGHVQAVFFCAALLISSALPAFSARGESKAGPWENWEHYKAEKPIRGGYFRTASNVDVGLLNPNHWPVNDWYVISYLFEKLLTTKGDYREIPYLLRSWEYLDDKTVLFRLRRGITYHDGTPHDAHALKFQMDWIRDKYNGCWSRAWLKPLEKVEVVGDYTVKFTHKEPWGSFLGIMASVPGYQISPNALKADVLLREATKLKRKADRAQKKAEKERRKAEAAAAKGGDAAAKAEKRSQRARKQAETLAARAMEAEKKIKGLKKSDTHPVGTAKWMLEDRNPGSFIKLKRNPNWWYGKTVGHPDMPYFDGRIVMVIPDPSVRLANLKAGKLDSLVIDRSQVADLQKDPKFRVYLFPLNWSVGLRFNHAKAPFNDIRMRKAVSHAIDRRALVAGLQFGMGRVASCFFPGDHWAHNPELKPVGYDPELSKKLLAEAGHPDGIAIKGYMGSDTESTALAEAVKAMLAQVGIKWEVEILSPAAIDDRVKNLEYDLGGNTYYWMYEPDLCVTNFYHPDGGWNHGRSRNERVIELIEAGRKETDPVKRRKIYHEIERHLYDDYEDVWLWWPIVPTAYAEYVRGYVFEGHLAHKEIWERTHPLWFKDGKAPGR